MEPVTNVRAGADNNYDSLTKAYSGQKFRYLKQEKTE